jgi:hypothetical protein
MQLHGIAQLQLRATMKKKLLINGILMGALRNFSIKVNLQED